MTRAALCGALAAASIGWGCVGGIRTPAASFEEMPPSGALPVKVDSEGPSVEQRVQYASTHAFVGWFGASAPMGRIVLMRRGIDLCAIRFTGFRAEDGASGPFYVPGPNVYAEYDWYYLTASPATSGHRKVSQTGGLGIPFFFPLGTGTWYVKCGSMEPWWSYPIAVRFNETNDSSRDFGIELAPTGWRDITEIDLAHPGLRWYRVNEKRKPFLIPLEALPQATQAAR